MGVNGSLQYIPLVFCSPAASVAATSEVAEEPALDPDEQHWEAGGGTGGGGEGGGRVGGGGRGGAGGGGVGEGRVRRNSLIPMHIRCV